MLKPFWQYYGGKWRAAPHYPKPRHDTIVEPFAGARTALPFGRPPPSTTTARRTP